MLLNPNLKQQAQGNKALEVLRDNKEFQDLVE